MGDLVKCCESAHIPVDSACTGYEVGMNGRCVYCDHEEKCHPGTGPQCRIDPLLESMPLRYNANGEVLVEVRAIVDGDKAQVEQDAQNGAICVQNAGKFNGVWIRPTEPRLRLLNVDAVTPAMVEDAYRRHELQPLVLPADEDLYALAWLRERFAFVCLEKSKTAEGRAEVFEETRQLLVDVIDAIEQTAEMAVLNDGLLAIDASRSAHGI